MKENLLNNSNTRTEKEVDKWSRVNGRKRGGGREIAAVVAGSATCHRKPQQNTAVFPAVNREQT